VQSADKVGDGVCGTAVAEEKNQLVEDVRELDNCLACSLSPLRARNPHPRGGIVGQFDIDSDERAAFTHENEALLEELAALISPRVASLAVARAG